MDVVRRDAGPASPACAPSLQDPSQQGFSASRGGGFPVELTDPRPRLGHARRRTPRRSWSEHARVRPRDRRRQRLPGRHARGAGDPRPQQGGRPRHLHGRHRRDRQRRHRRRARRQVQGQGPPLRHPRAPAGATSASGPRTSQRLFVRTRSGGLVRLGDIVQHRAGSPRCRPSRARTASAPSPSSPTWRRAPRRRDAIGPACSRSRAQVLPDGYRAIALRQQPGLPGVVRLAGLRVRAWASSWPTWCWPRSSTPSPTRSPCCWRCPSASAARSWRCGSAARA